jgi:hypothetical protein
MRQVIKLSNLRAPGGLARVGAAEIEVLGGRKLKEIHFLKQ